MSFLELVVMVKLGLHLSILLATFCVAQLVNAFPNQSKSAYSPPDEGKKPQRVRIQGTRSGECISKNNLPEFLVNSSSDTSSDTKVSISFPSINLTPLLFVVFDSSGTVFYSRKEDESKKNYYLTIPIDQKDLNNDQYELRTIIICRPELALNPYFEILF
mgnify:CR=1 FL=1